MEPRAELSSLARTTTLLTSSNLLIQLSAITADDRQIIEGAGLTAGPFLFTAKPPHREDWIINNLREFKAAMSAALLRGLFLLAGIRLFGRQAKVRQILYSYHAEIAWHDFALDIALLSQETRVGDQV